jgi:hypothetical protein
MDLNKYFTNFYEGVTLEKIHNVFKPCFFNGTDYLVLTPKDTECEFAYIREVADEKPIVTDLGGCNKQLSFLIKNLRFVYYNNECKNENEIISKFFKSFDLNYMNIKNIKKNKNELLRNECNIENFDLNLKNITYFCIDFELKVKQTINICQDVC